MTATTALRTAREYLRVSKGKGRSARSIDDQHTDNVAAGEEFGPWVWGTPYADTGSASKYATRARDDFDRLLADLTSGEFGQPGTVLVLWEISRLSRETGRGVALVDAVEAGGCLIHITSHDRTYNPANYQDRHSLISGINDAEKEARLLSARTLRGVNSALAKGMFHGKRPFGYARRYEIIDGRPRPVEQYADEIEAPLIRELFARVLGAPGVAAESIRAVSLDWKARGIASRKGVPFSPETLRSMLLNPLYIGQRSHNGQLTPGNWPGIVEPEIFHAVQRMLADPSRRTHTSTAVRHTYTGTLKCDVCPSHLSARRDPGDPDREVYVCHAASHVRIDKADADAFLDSVIVADLSRPEIYGPLSRDDDGEAAAVRADLSAKRADLALIEAAPAPKTARAMLAQTAYMEALETEIATLSARVSAASRPNPIAALFTPGPDVAAQWASTPVTVRRAVAAILFTPEFLGRAHLGRAPVPGAASPASERFRWYTDTATDAA